MPSEPAISVVIPAYNRGAQIAACVQSVLDQDFPDFEVVVVDDGSSDETARIVEAIDDRRVRCLRQGTNRGVCAARNRGILEANAPLIAFLDSDDHFLPHKLGFVARYFAEHDDVDVLLDSFDVVYPAALGRKNAPRQNPDLVGSDAVKEAVFARRIWKATPAMSARRQVLIDAGLFDETLRRRVDMDLILRLTRKARCASTSAVLWQKHWTKESISAPSDTFIPALIEICRRHPEYVAQPELRIGLARDIARHLRRLARRRELSGLRRELGRLRGYFGTADALVLIASGLREMARRRRVGAPDDRGAEDQIAED
jgi:glycosyltransferase involved in cell wall biosynthesis